MPMLSLEHSSFYDRLAGVSERFGVYDLPMGFSGPSKFYMYLQTIHGKPIVQGKMARPERDINAFIDGNPFTKHLRVTRKNIDPELTAVSRHLAYLADADVQYLVLHRDPQLEDALPSEDDWAAWQDWLTVDPLYEDDRIAVYPTRPRYGQDFEFEVDLGADIGIVEVGRIPQDLTQGETLDLALRWGSRMAPERDLKVGLSLVDGEGSPHHSMVVHPCADWPTSDWPTDAIAIGRYRFQLGPHLPPGPYRIRVELLGADRSATIGHLDVQPLPRVFEPPEAMSHPLDVRFEDSFALLGYDLSQGEDALRLTLHWQATQRPEKSYKIFVHLFDPATGAIVAQHDAVPRDWTYPTTWWEKGEVVTDELPLPMESVPPGEYALAVGMYLPESGERLAVVDEAGQSDPEGRLVLPEWVTW
jgi:hypothetical protein